MIKRLMAGVLLASLAVTAIAPAVVSAKSGGSDSQTTVDRLIAMNEKTHKFDTLIAAVVETDVVSVLNDTDDYTLFAPTDGAFARIGLNPGNVAEVPGLANILAYHVYAGGEVPAAAALTLRGKSVEMLSGDDAELSGRGKSLRIDGAQVVRKDIETSDAIIHVVNRVMLP
jgi:transforming growth factor-beta-induced protein